MQGWNPRQRKIISCGWLRRLWETLFFRAFKIWGKLSNYLSNVFTIFCFFHHWSKGPRDERKKSVCYHSANECWSLFLSHYCDLSPDPEFAFTYRPSQIDKPVASKAIQVLNKGSNYNTGINLVCSALTSLCILENFPMMLKHKSCNAMSDNSIIVTNNMKIKRKTIYRLSLKRINNRMFLRSGQETLHIIDMFYTIIIQLSA